MEFIIFVHIYYQRNTMMNYLQNSLSNQVVEAETNERMLGVAKVLNKLGGLQKVNEYLISNKELKLIIISDGSFKFVPEENQYPLATVQLSAYLQLHTIAEIRAKVKYDVECELNYAAYIERNQLLDELELYI